MASFITELKRRNVFKVGVAYAIVSWLIAQIVAVVNAPLNLPDWFDTTVIVLLLIGFPIALLFAWAFELTPEGIKTTKSVDPAQSLRQSTGQKLNYVIIGVMAFAIAFLLVDNYLLGGNGDSAILPNSVAVLPFESLSLDPDNAYFAAGIHDTILNELAKIRDMNVIARTSVLQYADGQTSIAQIAEDLNVETIMEGTVQYADGQVRITAQLIDPNTGSHMWSGNYDRNFADIFVIQSEIATRIATALEAEILPNELESIENPASSSPEAYALYLRALVIGRSNNEIRIQYLDQAIELDPLFAIAYATKAYFLAVPLAGDVIKSDDIFRRAAELEADVHENAEKALQLDPNLGIAHAAIARVNSNYWREDETRKAFELAVQLSPNNPEVLREFSMFSFHAGQHEDAITMALNAIELNPSIETSMTLILAYIFAGELNAAVAAGIKAVNTYPSNPRAYFALAEAETILGNYDAALKNLLLWEQLGYHGASGQAARAAQIYSQAGRVEDAKRQFARLEDMTPSEMQSGLAFLAIEDYEESLKLFQAGANSDYPEPGGTLTILVKVNIWDDPALETPEFLEVRSIMGYRE